MGRPRPYEMSELTTQELMLYLDQSHPYSNYQSRGVSWTRPFRRTEAVTSSAPSGCLALMSASIFGHSKREPRKP